MNKRSQFVKGFLDTVPLGISTAIYGLVYGVLGVSAGLTAWDMAAMSAIIFAGASQIAAVQMIALGSDALSIIATVFIINLRHYLLAASMAPKLREESKKMKMLTSFFMTDESYAVAYNHFQSNKPDAWYFWGCGISIYLFWGGSTVIGYFFGNFIPEQFNYVLGFAFVAAFIGMLVPMVRNMPAVVTVIASALISIFGSMVLPGKWYILIAGIVASLAGYLASLAAGKGSKVEQDVMEVAEHEQ